MYAFIIILSKNLLLSSGKKESLVKKTSMGQTLTALKIQPAPYGVFIDYSSYVRLKNEPYLTVNNIRSLYRASTLKTGLSLLL